MSRDFWILLAVGVAAYFFLFKKTAAAQTVSIPAPVGNNPSGGSTQVAPQDTFQQILDLIKATGSAVGDILGGTQAQTSAQRN